MGQLEQDIAQQFAVRRHLGNSRLHQVVEVARHQVALQHMGQFQHGAAELLKGVAGLVIEADLDKYQQTPLQMLRVEPGVVAHDDPFTL